jgi:hypothetical protein
MKRIITVLAVAALMVAMVVASAIPALALGKSRPSFYYTDSSGQDYPYPSAKQCREGQSSDPLAASSCQNTNQRQR